MVELECQAQEEALSDSIADALAIASAFQSTSDDDTRNVLNAMASKTEKSLEALKFYIVPASWFLLAWPVLSRRTAGQVQEGWRDKIGPIQNSHLLTLERAISSSDEEGERDDDTNDNDDDSPERRKKRFERLHRNVAKKRQHSTMRRGLVHMKDYFLLGPSAWLLVKEKFGYDGWELGRSCVFTSQNLVAIQLQTGEAEQNDNVLIQIPASGRFPYERVIDNGGKALKQSDIVSEDDTDGNDEFAWTNANSTKINGSANPQTEDEPILLLPPSTTGSNKAHSESAGTKGNYSAVDEMEVDTSTVNGNVTNGTSQASAAAIVSAGRKRFASGLGNLGNTCFMNSSVQCLAHTEPLRRYFLSGEYETDLNRDNPLGTGGELATQFAYLLSEMWGLPSKRRSVLGSNDYNYSNTSTSAVYPRSFKYTLGKHAEQFMGYDQHDSQELATYLLDALHEDTNRVTKKPYIEKPEQGEDESDEVAAMKAWRLHLQREDSRVLENFMGQVKSRVQCCEEGCNRVSTTFDPFMYLSVPIPGATDRSLTVTFIPLDPKQRMRNFTLTLNKTASMSSLLNKLNEEIVSAGLKEEPIPLEDFCAVDVWSNEVYSWYSNDNEIDRIRDTDNTFIYELRPVSEIREASEKDDTEASSQNWESRLKHRKCRYKLDLETLTRLNGHNEWNTVLESYVHQPTLLFSMLNPNRGTIEERVKFHQRLETFIGMCHKGISDEETTGLKRAREEESEELGHPELTVSPSDEPIEALSEQCEASTTFRNVKNRYDVAILEFCANKIRQFIMGLINDKKNKYKDGITIQVVFRRPAGKAGAHFPARDDNFASPLILRIPPNMSVYGLREEIASRLTRSIISGHPPVTSEQVENSGESSAETTKKTSSIPASVTEPFGSPSMLVMRQVPLTYDKKTTYASKSSHSSHKTLGMLESPKGHGSDDSRSAVMASASYEAEQALVAETVGPSGMVIMDWPPDLIERAFNLTEYEEIEGPSTAEASSTLNNNTEKVISVLDCIDKYCQMEQLEETEMWYCNRCKKHVRAWKQFHLYRAPPILIIHLKRFHYSATTHRRDKIGALIDFPLKDLDLTQFVSHWTEGEKPIYDCYAVSNHLGGLGGGHYTAYTMSDDGNWCHYDDSRLTNNVDPKEVISEYAYVLYYRRRDVPIGQDRIDDTPEPAIVEEQGESTRDTCEVSSNNTAQAGDDDMVVEADDAVSAASSRTCSSPMGSVEVGEDQYGYESGGGKAMLSGSGNFPLQ